MLRPVRCRRMGPQTQQHMACNLLTYLCRDQVRTSIALSIMGAVRAVIDEAPLFQYPSLQAGAEGLLILNLMLC
jgi:hypothetical protein